MEKATIYLESLNITSMRTNTKYSIKSGKVRCYVVLQNNQTDIIEFGMRKGPHMKIKVKKGLLFN